MQISNQEEDDMISQLPDEVLISIISLIPTKEALTTRILSKRWRNPFGYLSDLTFTSVTRDACHSRTCNSEPYFINGLHGLLQRHSAYIRSFDFRCCLPESCAHTFEQCIVSLGDLGIDKLNFRPSCYKRRTKFPFSFQLLSLMPSLQYFKLSYCSLLLPSLNYNNPCNSLKTLRLSNVCASPGSLECILSNCLSLFTLTFRMCELPSKLCFPRLVNLKLNCIVIHSCEGLEEIDFYAANLTTFDFNSFDMVNFIFDYVPQLQNVYLTSHRHHMSYFCGELAKCLHPLKTLVLDNIGNLYEDGCIAKGINMFNNLKRLELVAFTLDCLDMFSLALVLQGFTRLEEFHLSTTDSFNAWPEEEKQVFVHSQSQLKVVEISGFGGEEGEVKFALYILKSAARLEQMIISWHSSQYAGFGKWEENGDPPESEEWVDSEHPPYRIYDWRHVYECIQQMKHEAVSRTVQLVAQKFPKRKSKQF